MEGLLFDLQGNLGGSFGLACVVFALLTLPTFPKDTVQETWIWTIYGLSLLVLGVAYSGALVVEFSAAQGAQEPTSIFVIMGVTIWILEVALCLPLILAFGVISNAYSVLSGYLRLVIATAALALVLTVAKCLL